MTKEKGQMAERDCQTEGKALWCKEGVGGFSGGQAQTQGQQGVGNVFTWMK